MKLLKQSYKIAGRFFLSVMVITSSIMVSCTPDNRGQSFPEDEIRERIDAFQGDAGLYVYHLDSGFEFTIHPDTVFPTASTVKIPIMIGLFDKIERGEIEYTQVFQYSDEHADPWGDDIINQLPEGTGVELNRLIHLMMSTSNNTASLWNQYIAGTGTEINNLMDQKGFSDTKVNSRTPGREQIWEEYGWGHSTPRELARLLLNIYKGEMISPGASEKMYRIMGRNFWDGEALSQIPPYVNVASKNGSVARSKSEVLLVNAPSGDYLFALMTKNQEDRGSEYDNEGFVLLREISAILYNHFEPEDHWTPEIGTARNH
ncbi:serine hydrolase [Rhodohalobacter sp. SW132]|uniref:serine hydrolase n=1 Tax=Rhodohalobacter sp. SW132 TaxID=2293433 RepID=UPI000E271ECC|nr:serine hydrolase [Rhodohalobacter sp. SW132]REL25058.1 serine hydrolase [Rhodohalobacter sp. SW132]